MNQQGATGAQAAGQGSSNLSFMFRPERMRSITYLRQEDREKYEMGLRSLWNLYEKEPEGSAAKLAAQKKIQEFGQMLTQKLRVIQNAQAKKAMPPGPNQPQPSSQQQPQQSPPQTAMNQTPAPSAGQAPNVQGTGHGAPPGPAAPGPALTTGGLGAEAPTPMAPTAGAPPTQGGGGGQQSQQAKIPPQILQHVEQMPFHPPPNVAEKGPEVVAKWRMEYKKRYTQALYQMDQITKSIKSLDQSINERRAKGPAMSPEEQSALEERKSKFDAMHREASTFVINFRKQQDQLSALAANVARGGGSQGGLAGAAAGSATARAQQSQAPPQQTPLAAAGPRFNQPNMMAMQNSQANINGAFEAAKNQQQMAAMAARGGQVPTTAPPIQTSQTAATSATPALGSPTAQASQSQIKIEPGSQPSQLQSHAPHPQLQSQPHPPPVNTALAAAVAAGSLPPSAGTPTQNSARGQTPQSGTPTAPGPNARSLSHQAAISLANRHNSGSIPGAMPQPPSASQQQSQHQQPHQQHQHPQHPQHQQLQQPVNGSGSGTPSSAGPGVIGSLPHQPQQQQQQISAGGHPHAHPTHGQQQLLQSRLPISKTLPDKVQQTPQAVTMTGGLGPGRPTMTGGGAIPGGVINQPAIAKPSHGVYTQDEGDRVLSKKKLDELVKQVCGGSAEGHDGNALAPEVEESVLNLADSFVDNVLHSACRNAKERGSKVLEIRDIQLVLERVYNIRIPGYTVDELRTVRKVQPSAAWISKMSAVQAAKVMPGKNDP